MNKTKKTINVVALIALIIGIVLVIIGLMFGASTSFYIDRTGAHFEGAGKSYQINKKIGDINGLDINVSFTEVEVKVGEKNMVIATGMKKSNQPSIEVRNNKLYINSSKHKGFMIGFFNFPDRHSKITIYLTKDIKLNSSVIDNSFGSVKVDNLITDKLYIDSSFGEVTTNTTTKELVVDSSFGDIHTTVTSVSKVNISSSFGEVNLDVNGSKADYRIETNSSFGEINTDSNYTNTNGTHTGTISLDNSFGDINLRFLK